MREIFNSHPVSVLKKEISKTNIKGYSKMKKAQIVDLMMKNKERFKHIKMAEKKAPAPAKKAPEPKPAPAKKKKIKFNVLPKTPSLKELEDEEKRLRKLARPVKTGVLWNKEFEKVKDKSRKELFEIIEKLNVKIRKKYGADNPEGKRNDTNMGTLKRARRYVATELAFENSGLYEVLDKIRLHPDNQLK